MSFSIEEIRDIICVYGCFPKKLPGYEDFTEFRQVVNNELALGVDLRPLPSANGAFVGRSHQRRLLLVKEQVQYKFVCHDLSPRLPVDGDWILQYAVNRGEYMVCVQNW